MYEVFYGFSEKPFALRPDPAFLYLGKKHGTGLTMLQYGLANHTGITVLTGEIGCGKTTLVRRLLDEISDDIEVGLISNTHSSFGMLMQWVCAAFDLPSKARSKAALYDVFAQFLIEKYALGQRTVLIIDEAQNLDRSMLEELRLLTNINADKDDLLQLVLVGQPELREVLRDGRLRQFVQRVGVDFHLAPLGASETDEYIRHRLAVVGGDLELFNPVARRFVHLLAGGVPRRINALCDTALVYGFADQVNVITADLIAQIANERMSGGLFGAGIMGEESEVGSPLESEKKVQAVLRDAMRSVHEEQGASVLDEAARAD